MQQLLPGSDLNGLIGSNARLWQYSASHGRMAIEISPPDGGKKYLHCLFCERMSVRHFWRMQNPQILDAKDRDFIFKDGEVEIKCRELVLTDSSEPQPP